MIKLFEEFVNKKVIYHFTESYDSLYSILADDCLYSGEHSNHGRGYENISFTWNPNLWDIEYFGDWDYRWKAKIAFDYERMSKEWKFESFDYGIEEEQEERIVSKEMDGIKKYITKIYLSSEFSRDGMEYLKKTYPEIKFTIVRRKKFKRDTSW